MTQSNINNSGKWWLIIKLILVICSLWFIYKKVTGHESSADYFLQLKTAFMQPNTAILFFIVFVLMILNWTTEAVKWRYMIRKVEMISTKRSLEAVFSGLTVSFFTPNRIGEYAGRVFHLKEGRRMQATFITVIENCSQLLVTIITGSIACIFYMKAYLEIDWWIFYILRFMLFAFVVFCIVLYFNLDLFEKIFQRFHLSEYWKKIIHVFALYSKRELMMVLILSGVRYIIFSLQFYLLMRIYGSSFPLLPCMMMISMTFFVMSIVPTFTIAELGIRGAVSAYFFGKITIDVLPVLNATFSLWLVNLAIPALIGAFFIFDFRFEKSEK
jgi:hypothetical protein